MNWRIDRFDEIDSTNTYLLNSKALPGLVAVAGFQTAGRGRLDRSWEALPGDALLFSALLPVDTAPIATRAMALAVSDACPFATGLKWPNDVLSDGRKLAGILAETRSSSGVLEALVVGCGLNVRRAPLETAAFYEEWTPAPTDLLGTILGALSDWIEAPEQVPEAFRRRCVTIGTEVRIESNAGSIQGIAIDVADDGALVIESAGEIRRFTIGDVIHTRS